MGFGYQCSANDTGLLLTSLARYAVIVYGSGANEGGIEKLDTRLINIAARRTPAVSRSAPIATLRSLAYTMPADNPYPSQCAGSVDGALQAFCSTIRETLMAWARSVCGVRDWGRIRTKSVPTCHRLVTGIRCFYEIDALAEWWAPLLSSSPFQIGGSSLAA